jgi:hypothetical protein
MFRRSSALVFGAAVMLVLAATALGTARSASAKVVASPVTNIKLSPTPFYADLPTMSVSFKTTVPAPAGRLYFVKYQTLTPMSMRDYGCAPISGDGFHDRGLRGGRNTTIKVTLRPWNMAGDHFCTGLAKIEVFTQLAANRSRREPPTVGLRLSTSASCARDALAPPPCTGTLPAAGATVNPLGSLSGFAQAVTIYS